MASGIQNAGLPVVENREFVTDTEVCFMPFDGGLLIFAAEIMLGSAGIAAIRYSFRHLYRGAESTGCRADRCEKPPTANVGGIVIALLREAILKNF